MASDQSQTTQTCVFCALHCDDLPTDGKTQLSDLCPKAAEGFAAVAGDLPEALIGGQTASIADALEVARKLLKKARKPLVSGLGADVAGSRAALDLARDAKAFVDPYASPAQYAQLSVMQRQGMINTTYSEVRNRADLVICLGPDVLLDVPRLAERCFTRTMSIDGTDLQDRRIIVLGGTKKTRLPEGATAEVLAAKPADIPAVLQALRARMAGRPAALSKALDTVVATLAEAIAASRYAAIAWQVDRWLGDAPALVIESLQDFIVQLNQKQRAASLPVGGHHGAATAGQVTAWRTGYALGLRFERSGVCYRPQDIQWQALLNGGDADLLLWVDAFRALPAPAAGAVPTIVVGGSDAARAAAAVALPAGVPGVHHDAQLIRGDQVVSLTVRAPKATASDKIPTAAAMLEALAGTEALKETA